MFPDTSQFGSTAPDIYKHLYSMQLIHPSFKWGEGKDSKHTEDKDYSTVSLWFNYDYNLYISTIAAILLQN